MKHTLVYSILFAAVAGQASVVPTNATPTPVNDPYVNYQWALWNNGQSVVLDLDDIHSETLVGNPKAQIGWSPAVDAKMTRDVVVAVIDSGVDVEHEDLQGRILLNEKECKDKRIPTGPTGDPDKNGFEGDCMGWSFAAPNKQKARFVDDDAGHGTHIAGIIAATFNNAKGIAGVSNRIKILPVKVYDDKDTRGSQVRRDSISDRVANAIDYSVLRGADVINLSLGWPRMNLSARVKQAISNALAKNVIIVAGAGNDRHEGQIYPCAFSGVLCVGSVEIDGSISRFSNFGGHVDILAPGGEILSLWPANLTSNIFGAKGYEILSGTSQAAPYVSGVAAVLKGIFRNATNQEIRARILGSASDASTTGEAFSLRGLLNLEKSISGVPQGLALPEFKGLEQVIVDDRKGSFAFHLPIENISADETGLGVEVESLNPEVELRVVNGALSIQRFGKGDVNIEGRLKSLDASALLRFKLKIKTSTGLLLGQYEHQLILARSMNAKGTILKIEGGFTDISSVKTYGISRGKPEFFRAEKVDGGTLLKLFRVSPDGLVVAGELNIPEISDLVPDMPVLRVDLNLDGQYDYFVSGYIRDSNGDIAAVQYSVFGPDLKPLFGSQRSNWKLNYESVLIDSKNLRFGVINVPGFGRLAVPAFWKEGMIPKSDANPDPFAFEVNAPAYRWYYFAPALDRAGNVSMQTHLVTNFDFFAKAQRALRLRATDDLKLHGSPAQSEEDIIAGRNRMIVSTGSGVLRKYFVLTFEGEGLRTRAFSVVNANYGGADLQHQSFDDMLAMDSKSGGERLKTQVLGIFDQIRARSMILSDPNAETLSSTVSVKLLDPHEHIMGVIESFDRDGEVVSFLETDTRLIVSGSWDQKKIYSESPIYRSSFLPGQYFSQRFVPVWIGSGVNAKPALVIDNSRIFSPTVFAWTLNGQAELTIPLRLSFEVPNNCRVLNPARNDGEYQLTLLCASGNESTLQLVPMK